MDIYGHEETAISPAGLLPQATFTVNFRSHKKSYKDKSGVKNQKDEWMIFENTHAAIVDRETWELTQKLRKTPKRIDTIGIANLFTGLLYCADCGERLKNIFFNHAFCALRHRPDATQGTIPNKEWSYN